MSGFDSEFTLKGLLFKIHGNVELIQESLCCKLSRYIGEVVASNEALLKDFGDKFDAHNATIILGFRGIRESVEELRDDINYGFSLLAEQIEFQTEKMTEKLTEIASTLDKLYKIASDGPRYEARAHFLRGCELLRKGFLDEARKAFNKADETYHADAFTNFQLGWLYLFGKNKIYDVVNLEQAERHFELAARYGEAEIKSEPKMKQFTAEALFLLSLALYLQAMES